MNLHSLIAILILVFLGVYDAQADSATAENNHPNSIIIAQNQTAPGTDPQYNPGTTAPPTNSQGRPTGNPQNNPIVQSGAPVQIGGPSANQADPNQQQADPNLQNSQQNMAETPADPQVTAETEPVEEDDPIDESADAKTLYQEGIARYQDGKYKAASSRLKRALMQDPNNPYILYNLGLSSYRLEKTGEAVGYWRKALTLSPGMGPVREAMRYATDKNSSIEQSGSVSSWERYRKLILIRIGTGFFYILCLILFFSSGWLWLQYFGKRKRAYDEETPLPPPPYVPIVLSLGLLVSAALLATKIYDQFHPRGTIIAGEVKAKSGPSDSASELFDLYEATEVILGKVQGEWIQVSYPDGLTGWVHRKQVFQTSGEPL